ncbi:MAG: DUF5362 family protein [Lentisphaeria bacterium]|jgi:hypothetical protein|nr:DUF5362 family protein [Lentisphaeria bacterium]MDP7743185.1 DUF5362 family protein [Lentisphaeria bacterium]
MDQANPYQMPESGSDDYSPQLQSVGPQLLAPLYAVKGWIKFIGVMMIIYGALQCVAVFTAVIGWIPIWIGIKLNRAAGLVTQAFESGNESVAMAATEELGSALKILGIFFLVGLILLALVIIVYIVIIVVAVGVFASAAAGAGS